MNYRTEFWWVTVADDEPQVARVRFTDWEPRWISRTGTDIEILAREFIALRVRLIERVLPAGRVTAAGLRDALVACGWLKSGYVGALQGCEVTGEDGEPTGEANTLIDGYFDLEKGAAILQGGDA